VQEAVGVDLRGQEDGLAEGGAVVKVDRQAGIFVSGTHCHAVSSLWLNVQVEAEALVV